MAYSKTTWSTGDVITAALLNNNENGTENALLQSGDTRGLSLANNLTFVSGADRRFGLTDNYNLLFLINNLEKMRLDTSGRLGIGITPAYSLHVAGDILNQDDKNGIVYNIIKNSNFVVGQNRFVEYQAQGTNNTVNGIFKAGSDTSNYGSIQYGSISNHDVLFLINGVEKIKLNTSGHQINQSRLGLNGIVPIIDLHLNEAIQFGNSATATNNSHITKNGAGGFQFWKGNYGSGTKIWEVDGNGNVTAQGAVDATDLKVNGDTIFFVDQSGTLDTVSGGSTTSATYALIETITLPADIVSDVNQLRRTILSSFSVLFSSQFTVSPTATLGGKITYQIGAGAETTIIDETFAQDSSISYTDEAISVDSVDINTTVYIRFYGKTSNSGNACQLQSGNVKGKLLLGLNS